MKGWISGVSWINSKFFHALFQFRLSLGGENLEMSFRVSISFDFSHFLKANQSVTTCFLHNLMKPHASRFENRFGNAAVFLKSLRVHMLATFSGTRVHTRSRAELQISFWKMLHVWRKFGLTNGRNFISQWVQVCRHSRALCLTRLTAHCHQRLTETNSTFHSIV